MVTTDDNGNHTPVRVDRRKVLAGGTAIVTGGAAGCLGSNDSGGGSGNSGSQSGTGNQSGSGASGGNTKIHILNLEGSMFVPVFFYGKDQNAWSKRGIDLSVEVTGFGKFSRTFSQNLATKLSPLSSLPLAENLAGDTSVKCFGQCMNFINQCFVAKDSDIQKPTDLKGKTLGVPGRGSSTTRYYQALWAEQYGFDVLNDPAEIVDVDTATLYNFLKQGKEVDAGILFTSSTISALANDNLRSIYDPVEYWEQEHGHPPSVTMFGVYNDFLNSNPQTVYKFWQGWKEALKAFRGDFDKAIQKHGAAGGIDMSSDAEIKVVRRMVKNNGLFPNNWGPEWIQSNMELFKLVANNGGIPSAPTSDDFVTTQSLQESS